MKFVVVGISTHLWCDTCVMSMFLTWLNIKIPFTRHKTTDFNFNYACVCIRFNWNKHFRQQRTTKSKFQISFNVFSLRPGQKVKMPLLWILKRWGWDKMEVALCSICFAKPVQRIHRVHISLITALLLLCLYVLCVSAVLFCCIFETIPSLLYPSFIHSCDFVLITLDMKCSGEGMPQTTSTSYFW